MQMMLMEMRRTMVFDKYMKDIKDNICGIGGERIKWTSNTAKLVIRVLQYLEDPEHSAPLVVKPASLIKFICHKRIFAIWGAARRAR